MIGFATPWIFGIALTAALAITVLHLLSVRQPRVLMLPTARFVPERDARAVARQAKPSDVPILLLRVLALLAAGAALAGARCGERGARVASLLVIDQSLRADSAALVSRAVREASAGERVDAEPPSVVWVSGLSHDPGIAIVAAIRESARQAQANPSLAELSLTVVMPKTVHSRLGWDAWRGLWPARIQLLSAVAAASSDTAIPATFGTVRVVTSDAAVGAVVATDVVATDVVEAAFASRGALIAGGSEREVADAVVYRVTTAADSRDRIVVQWPESGRPNGWRVAPPLDSVGAVTSAGRALVAPWVRTALPPALSDSVQAIAWWSDGVAAAIERTRGTSCVREVAIAVTARSDLLLSPAADGLLQALRAPCGGVGIPAPREPVSGNVAAPPFREAGMATRTTQPLWLATVLLAVAFAALLAEHVLRRASAGAAAA